MADNKNNYNDSTPSAPAGSRNVQWQAEAADPNVTVPRHVSAYMDPATTGHPGLLPTLSGSVTDALRGDGTFGPPSGAATVGIKINGSTASDDYDVIVNAKPVYVNGA